MLDYDPGTLVTLDVGAATAGSETRVVCLSYDNIVRHPVRELATSLGSAARASLATAMSLLANRFVDHVFVLSEDSAAVMRGYGFGDRTTKVPLGFDPLLFRPDEAARSRIRAQLGLRETTFAYFGRVVPEKGAHTLLEALHRIRDRPWQLLLDHFADYKHPYVAQVAETISRLGLADRVVFFDAPHERMGEFMNAADIVVMPSRSNVRWKEQYGRVAAEAMACGRTVVVSSSGALPELVGDAGVVVEEDALGSLSDVLAGLLDDPQRRSALGARAAARAAGHLSMPVQVARMHEVFTRLVSRDPATR
jgi:glycosyltransferase involved in cell wall biosynthesis